MFRWLRRREPQPCETCRFCLPAESFRGWRGDVHVMEYAKCTHPKKSIFTYCATQREGISRLGAWFIGLCGPQGRWWKPKE